jgi:hypothetical protein
MIENYNIIFDTSSIILKKPDHTLSAPSFMPAPAQRKNNVKTVIYNEKPKNIA